VYSGYVITLYTFEVTKIAYSSTFVHVKLGFEERDAIVRYIAVKEIRNTTGTLLSVSQGIECMVKCWLEEIDNGSK